MTVGVTIGPTGAVAPSYADVFAQLQNAYWSIYGTDAQLSADTQDGQFLGVLAQAITDCNNAVLATYSAFGINSAQGAGLSSLVKLIGIRRKAASNSQATVTITGQPNTIITNGLIGDNQNLGTTWALPPTVTIPNAGQIAVTATCTTPGAIAAATNTLLVILTPTNGWQSVSNTNPATLGAPVETDAALRQRVPISTALASSTTLAAITAAVADVANVVRSTVYQNDTDTVDGNGQGAHSAYAVVQGGTVSDIATAIFNAKSPGLTTLGTTSFTVIDPNGVPDTINFYVLAQVTINVVINIHALAGYTSAVGNNIKLAVAAYLSQLGIGVDSFLNRLYAPANLAGDVAVAATGLTQAQLDAQSATYNVVTILQSRAGPPAAADVVLAFNEAAVCVLGNIALNLV